jgi:hypothetical protein
VAAAATGRRDRAEHQRGERERSYLAIPTMSWIHARKGNGLGPESGGLATHHPASRLARPGAKSEKLYSEVLPCG